MRKFIGLAVVIAFLWVSAAPAEAVSLVPGEMLAKNFDYSSFYTDTDNDGIADTPLAEEALPVVGDELRAIFEVTGIWNNFTGLGLAYWVPGPGDELTGLFYDLKVSAVNVAVGVAVIDFVPGGRYATASAVPGSGGRIDLWRDTTAPDYNHLGTGGGPTDWLVGPVAGHAHDDYPTASDVSDLIHTVDAGASLFLQGNWVPMGLVATPAVVYQLTLNLGTGHGSGLGFWDVIVNNAGVPIADDFWSMPGGTPYIGTPGSGSDVYLQTTVDLGIVGEFGGWQVKSQDPVQLFALPEPATMSLLLVGLVGGAGAYLRRRRAA